MVFLKVFSKTDFRFEFSVKNYVLQHQTKILHFCKMLDFEIYNVRNMPKILLKHCQNIAKTCPKHAQIIAKTCPKHVRRAPKDVQNASNT